MKETNKRELNGKRINKKKKFVRMIERKKREDRKRYIYMYVYDQLI